MCARADFILETFGSDADKVAFLVDGFVGGPGMITTARRQYPNQYLHYHRAGHGMITSPSAKRGYSAYVLAKMARLQGASGIHVGTMGYGKMEGAQDDRAIAYIIERDEYQGPAYFQRWYGMKPTTPIISGGMNALRLARLLRQPRARQRDQHGGWAVRTGISTRRRRGRSRCGRRTSAGRRGRIRCSGRSRTASLRARSSRSLAMPMPAVPGLARHLGV
jgi:hypothetical protein